MLRLVSNRRVGFSLIELLVVIAIIGILVGLLMSAVQKARDAARRVETLNNLHQLGLAFHLYHDGTNTFPSESAKGNEGQQAGATMVSFYTTLLPYIEQQNATAGTPIKVFTCPSRHVLSASSTDGPADFGYQATASASSILNPVAVAAILDQPINLSLGQLTELSGSSNTLLLSMVSENPTGDSNLAMPTTWYATTPIANSTVTTSSHGTKGTQFTEDTSATTTGKGLGAPYPATPSLYADGHTAMIPNGKSASLAPTVTVYSALWSYNNTHAFTAP